MAKSYGNLSDPGYASMYRLCVIDWSHGRTLHEGIVELIELKI